MKSSDGCIGNSESFVELIGTESEEGSDDYGHTFETGGSNLIKQAFATTGGSDTE